jgi:hypothetical protein
MLDLSDRVWRFRTVAIFAIVNPWYKKGFVQNLSLRVLIMPACLSLHAAFHKSNAKYSPHFTRQTLRGVVALVRFGGRVYW